MIVHLQKKFYGYLWSFYHQVIHNYQFIVVTLSLTGVKFILHFGWLCGRDWVLVAKVAHS